MHGDYVHLRQILINILSNAIKYNRPHGSVILSCRRNGDKVRISVSDTGSGIPVDKHDRVFNSFDRLGKENGTVEGTGIGLVITKSIVEAMGGSIGFDSVEGEGCTFWVEFKAIELAQFPIDKQSKADPTLNDHGFVAPSGQRILLAEDNPANQHLVIAVLKRLGYAFDVVDNGEKAVTAAAGGQYALVLMDCQMPEMDGYKAAAAIRCAEKSNGGRRLPIIAMTANAMGGDREKCLTAGMDDYVTKPITISHLQEKLAAWITP